jgi:hypothetical protein
MMVVRNLIIKEKNRIGLQRSGSGGGRLSLRKLRTQLEALLQIQLEQGMEDLLSLLVNEKGWLEIPHHQQAR